MDIGFGFGLVGSVASRMNGNPTLLNEIVLPEFNSLAFPSTSVWKNRISFLAGKCVPHFIFSSIHFPLLLSVTPYPGYRTYIEHSTGSCRVAFFPVAFQNPQGAVNLIAVPSRLIHRCVCICSSSMKHFRFLGFFPFPCNDGVMCARSVLWQQF